MIWMGTVIGILTIVVFLLLWYSFKVTKDLVFVSDEIGELEERVEEYRGHLEIVYGLETFYGDETLGNLLRHTKNFERYLGAFRDITDLTLPETTEEGETKLDDYEDEEENNPSQKTTTQTGKVVFHQGA